MIDKYYLEGGVSKKGVFKLKSGGELTILEEELRINKHQTYFNNKAIQHFVVFEKIVLKKHFNKNLLQKMQKK